MKIIDGYVFVVKNRAGTLDFIFGRTAKIKLSGQLHGGLLGGESLNVFDCPTSAELAGQQIAQIADIADTCSVKHLRMEIAETLEEAQGLGLGDGPWIVIGKYADPIDPERGCELAGMYLPEKIMAWPGLFLWHNGLTPFSGADGFKLVCECRGEMQRQGFPRCVIATFLLNDP